MQNQPHEQKYLVVFLSLLSTLRWLWKPKRVFLWMTRNSMDVQDPSILEKNLGADDRMMTAVKSSAAMVLA